MANMKSPENMTKRDIETLRKELTEFVHSAKGEKAIRMAIEDTVKAKKEFEDETRTDIESFYRPMTI